MFASDLDSVPETASQVRLDTEYQVQKLKGADDECHGNGDCGQYALVVKYSDRIFGQPGGSIEAHHSCAIECIQHTHSSCEK